MLSITFATVKIHIYYLTVASFTADITHKPCLLEINELVGSGAGRKSPVNIKEVWGHFGMESKNVWEVNVYREWVHEERVYT